MLIEIAVTVRHQAIESSNVRSIVLYRANGRHMDVSAKSDDVSAERLYDRLLSEGEIVWRAVFMALGLNAMLLGGECFVLDRIELSKSFTSVVAGRDPLVANSTSPSSSSIFQNSAYQPMMYGSSEGSGRIFRPREWMPWSLLAAGAIIVMYTSSYAKKPA